MTTVAKPTTGALQAADRPPDLDALDRSVPAIVSRRDDSIARDIERGVMRLLRDHAMARLCQLMLPDGRRADVVGLGADGRIAIIEIKSGLADFQADLKWPHYREYADALYFAVQPSFPVDVLPTEAGLILADRFGGVFERAAAEHPLTAARRKAMIVRFARAAAGRLHGLADPDAGAGFSA